MLIDFYECTSVCLVPHLPVVLLSCVFLALVQFSSFFFYLAWLCSDLVFYLSYLLRCDLHVSSFSMFLPGFLYQRSHCCCRSSSFLFVCRFCFTVFWYSILLVVFSSFDLCFGFCYFQFYSPFEICDLCIFLDFNMSLSFGQNLSVSILLFHS